jgi:HK97 family phage portal protein
METRRFAQTMKAAISGQGVQLKAADQTFFPRFLSHMASWVIGMPRTAHNYAGEVGHGLLSSSVMPALQWGMRTFPEATLIVQRQVQGTWETIDDHPLVELVNRANPWYDGGVLWMATVRDYLWDGNAYWRILRRRSNEPGELWWMPPWCVQPRWKSDGSEFISYYDYTPMEGASYEQLRPEEVIHFRHSLDPVNPRLGLPPLRAIVRDIWTDDEAANFTATLLRNSAVPSTLISPDPQGGEGTVITSEQAELIKHYFDERFTGDSRGQTAVVNGPLKVQRLGFAPNEIDLSALRNVTEERVCAAVGFRAAVVGYGTGLEQTKVGATMAEETKMCWVNGLIPMQRVMGTTLGRMLLPLFGEDTSKVRVTWDYSEVRALQEEEGTKVTRLSAAVQGGWMRVDEARDAAGLESEESDKVYLRTFAMIEVPAGEPMQRPQPTGPQLVPNDGEGDVEQRALKAAPYQTKADPAAMDRLLNRLEPSMRAAFLRAVQQTKANIDEEALNAALRIFDAAGASAAIPWDQFAASFGAEATALLRQAAGEGGAVAARGLMQDLHVLYRFDVLNPSAVQWAQQHAAKMVREITLNTEEAIRDLVTASMRGQMTWQQVSRQVHDIVGLHSRQALAVSHFEQRLREEGVGAERLALRVERYAAAQLRLRSDNIARTEILTASNAGQIIAWDQAEMQGLLDRQTTFKVWIVADDERLCELCEPLDGEEVALHGTFPGGLQAPPLHPSCRCAVGLVFHAAAVPSAPLGAAVGEA